MIYLEGLAIGATVGAGIFFCLVGIGAAVKVTQWIGQKLKVKPLDFV